MLTNTQIGRHSGKSTVSPLRKVEHPWSTKSVVYVAALDGWKGPLQKERGSVTIGSRSEGKEKEKGKKEKERKRKREKKRKEGKDYKYYTRVVINIPK